MPSAGDPVGSRCTPYSIATRAQRTYLADDTSLEVATLETRQKQSSGVTRSGSSCASEESDSVETHGDLFETDLALGSVTSVIGAEGVCVHKLQVIDDWQK